MYSFHYNVIIFPPLCNLSVNWSSSTKSSGVFAHRWQFIICCEQFPYYYSSGPHCKRSIFTPRPQHTHTHTLPGLSMLMQIELVGRYIKSSQYGRNENANFRRRYEIAGAALSHPWVVVSPRRDSIRWPRLHLSMLSSSYGETMSPQAPVRK